MDGKRKIKDSENQQSQRADDDERARREGKESSPSNKKQRREIEHCAEERKGQEVDEDSCAVCMRSREELQAADAPLRDEHGCAQCTKTSWSICEECEEHHLSRKCPVCRGEYAPMMMYVFPDLEPDSSSTQPSQEVKLFHAKMSLLLKIVEGSNTAVYLPGQGLMKFFLPQSPGTDYNTAQRDEVRFLEVDIPISPDRLRNEEFAFTDKVWDELEAAQGIIDEAVASNVEAVTEAATAERNDEDDAQARQRPVYTVVSRTEFPSSGTFQDKIFETFYDVNDRCSYKIEAICTSSAHAQDKFFFKYYNIDRFPDHPPDSSSGSEEAYEYSPCEEIMEADGITWSKDQEEWIQCVSCDKWRKIPSSFGISANSLPDNWTCQMSQWSDELKQQGCQVVEENYENVVSVSERSVDNMISSTRPDSVGEVHRDDSTDTQADLSQYTIDIRTAVRHIVKALKENIGNKLYTRLTPEASSSVIRLAMQQ